MFREKGARDRGDDQKKKEPKEIDHRPWSTPVNECVRERNRGEGEGEAVAVGVGVIPGSCCKP